MRPSSTRMRELAEEFKNSHSCRFSLMLLLMVGLTVIGLTRIMAVNEEMEEIRRVNYVKTTLVSEMRSTARDHAISLHRLALLTDPFEWDEELVEFGRIAARFIQAREKLLELGLDQEEKDLLAQSLELVKKSEQLQATVVLSFQQGKLAEAHHFLLKEVIPLRNG